MDEKEAKKIRKQKIKARKQKKKDELKLAQKLFEEVKKNPFATKAAAELRRLKKKNSYVRNFLKNKLHVVDKDIDVKSLYVDLSSKPLCGGAPGLRQQRRKP